MKRAIAIILALVMVLALTSCSGSGNTASNKNSSKTSRIDEVKKALIGFWVVKKGNVLKRYDFYNDGRVAYKGRLGNIQHELEGTYTVKENEIEIVNETGNSLSFSYTYKDGKLRVFEDGIEMLFNGRETQNIE